MTLDVKKNVFQCKICVIILVMYCIRHEYLFSLLNYLFFIIIYFGFISYFPKHIQADTHTNKEASILITVKLISLIIFIL